MTSQSKRQRERDAREARALQAMAVAPELAGDLDPVEAFKPALAALVDALLDHVGPDVRAAMHELLSTDRATLRLAIVVAPDLSMSLYLATPGDPPRVEPIAIYGDRPPVPEIPRETAPVH
jgi:hypothetical protein